MLVSNYSKVIHNLEEGPGMINKKNSTVKYLTTALYSLQLDAMSLIEENYPKK